MAKMTSISTKLVEIWTYVSDDLKVVAYTVVFYYSYVC